MQKTQIYWMLKAIKNLLKANALLFSILITSAIAYLSLVKAPVIPYEVSNLDKVQHSFAYFVLTLSWFFTLKNNFLKYKHVVVISCFFYGILLEVLQSTITSLRTGDVFDVFANSIGVTAAFFVFNRIYKKNKAI